MESPLSPSHVVIVYDAMKDRSEHELNLVVDSVRARGDILRAGDTLVVLGIMQRVQHPMGYQAKAYPDAFGLSNRAMEEEVSKKVDSYVNMLLRSAEKCEDQGVSIEVKITAGFPIKHVTIQEVITCKANWVVLDRYLRRDLTFYLKQIPCKVALIQDGLSVDILRRHTTRVTDAVDHKLFYSMSKPVPLFNYQSTPHVEQSSFFFGSYSLSMGSLESSETHKSNMMPSYFLKSHDPSTSLDFGSFSKQEKSGAKGQFKSSNGSQTIEDSTKNTLGQRSLDVPLLCVGCGTRTELYIKDAMRFSFYDIQLATDDFSKENLIGEGGYGHVYKGKLKHGQLIAAKVRKEASEQGFAEFHSEVYVLSFARHKNIIMLLGHCCKENLNILVYEYICNKSLDWHLYDKAATALEWHQRYAVAIGTAKGLRFLHEECRGGPIIHRDMRPSNILLTHDFIPMLGDFGLAKWKTSDDPVQTRILGTLGYLAPEYAENGIVSVRTDVYAFGIILLQLISGRKAVDSKQNEKQQSLRQWAEPIIEKLALHELVDPRLGDAYDPYELYIIAKAAYMCVQRSPEMRPSMGEVVRLLEGESDHFRHLEQCVPRYSEVKASITRLNSDSDT